MTVVLPGSSGSLGLATCLSSLVAVAFPDLATRWGRLHRTSDLATGFFPEVTEAWRGCLPETEEVAGRRAASSQEHGFGMVQPLASTSA